MTISEATSKAVLIFPFSKVNANSISALLASLDIHPTLKNLKVILPNIIDSANSIISKIEPYSKVILAFSLYSTQLEQIRDKISEYREILEGINLLVILGGPHAIGSPKSALLNGADVVCTGEGEIVFCNIIKSWLLDQEFKDVKGIAFYDSKKTFVRTSKEISINLDDFPPFSIKHKLIRPIEITRGCAWSCRFCQIRSKGFPVRHRSIDEIVKYVKLTVDHFRLRVPDIRFISPNAFSYGSEDGKTVNLEVIDNLLSRIRRVIGEKGRIYFGSFPSELRPETVTHESAEILQKYTNAKKLILGGQSGSDAILKSVDRGHSVQETERAVKILIDYGFSVDVDIIFGLPNESEIDIKLTVEHVERLTDLGATIHSHTFLPLVGTPLASAPPGTINGIYLNMINKYQGTKLLSGQHIRQEKQAEVLAKRRKEEKQQFGKIRP